MSLLGHMLEHQRTARSDAVPAPARPVLHDSGYVPAPVVKLTLLDKIKLIRLLRDKAMLEKIKSRKFFAFVAVTVVTAAGGYLGMPQGIIDTIAHLAMTYIAGQGAVDAAAAWSAK